MSKLEKNGKNHTVYYATRNYIALRSNIPMFGIVYKNTKNPLFFTRRDLPYFTERLFVSQILFHDFYFFIKVRKNRRLFVGF